MAVGYGENSWPEQQAAEDTRQRTKHRPHTQMFTQAIACRLKELWGAASDRARGG